MMKSFLALTLAFSLSAGTAALAQAEPQTPPAARQMAQLPVPDAPNAAVAAVKAYNANLNPIAVIPSIGIYDQEDGYTGPTGTPLPGWGSVFGEGAGDN